MQFLAPWMMLGMTAAAVPLVLHLLRRSKPMVVRFAAMEFLRKSVQETSKRIRFRDLILMLMRMGVLMLLAFAMARPTLSLISGSGPVDAAILVDVSRSMATVEGQSSRLEQAVKAAGALLDHLPKGSTARLFAVSDRVADLGIGQAGEFDSLREALANLAPTDRSGDLFPAFASAIDLLRSSPLSQRKVFLFSDMQPAGWQKQGDALRALAKNLPPATALHMVQTGTPVPSNLQVMSMSPVAGICFAGQRQAWQVRIQNQGDQPATDIVVHLGIADDPTGGETVRLDRLDGGEERAVAMDLLLPSAGYHPVLAKAGTDRLDRDNQLHKVIQARDRVRVLVVSGKSSMDGNRPAGFFLTHALRALVGDNSVGRLEVKEARPDRALPDFLDEADLLVLADPALAGPEGMRPDFLERITPWVKSGKPLWYFVGSNAANRADEKSHPLENLLYGLPQPVRPLAANQTQRLNHAAIPTGDWLGEFRTAPLDQVSQAEFKKITPITSSGNNAVARSLVRFNDGAPALLLAPLGNGLVVSAPWVPDLDFTDLPLRPSFVPLIQTLLAKTLEGAEDPRTLPVTGSLGIHLPSQESAKAGDFFWLDPGGVKLPVVTRKENDRLFCFNEAPMDKAGLWKLQSTGKSFQESDGLVAVQGAIDEGRELTPMQPAEIDDLFGLKVQHEQVTGDNLATWTTLGEISSRILPLVMLLFVLEALFAWWCGRPL